MISSEVSCTFFLGATTVTGGAGGSIVSLQSWGPSVSVFNPNDVGSRDPVPATVLVGYPSAHPLHDFSSANPYFNAATVVNGVVFPQGTRTVLFFGKHGLGLRDPDYPWDAYLQS